MSHPAAESVLTLKPRHKLAGRKYLGGLLHLQDAEINEVSPFKGLLSFTLSLQADLCVLESLTEISIIQQRHRASQLI